MIVDSDLQIPLTKIEQSEEKNLNIPPYITHYEK